MCTYDKIMQQARMTHVKMLWSLIPSDFAPFCMLRVRTYGRVKQCTRACTNTSRVSSDQHSMIQNTIAQRFIFTCIHARTFKCKLKRVGFPRPIVLCAGLHTPTNVPSQGVFRHIRGREFPVQLPVSGKTKKSRLLYAHFCYLYHKVVCLWASRKGAQSTCLTTQRGRANA
jgi:hypothetical protein